MSGFDNSKLLNLQARGFITFWVLMLIMVLSSLLMYRFERLSIKKDHVDLKEERLITKIVGYNQSILIDQSSSVEGKAAEGQKGIK
jgi:hypothetical protein